VARHAGLRWLRALTLASVMLASGLSGHVAVGGAAPPGALLGPMLLVLTLAVSPFLDAPASSRRIVALVLVGQAGLHLVVELVGRTPTTHAAPMAMSASPAHAMSPAMTGDLTPTSAAAMSAPHVLMLLAHVGAVLVVALWLAAGERAAWTLVAVVALTVTEAWRTVRDAVCAPSALVLLVRRPPRVSSIARCLVVPSVWDGFRGLVRRGPPVVCSAA
jgi:hypothetical protein